MAKKTSNVIVMEKGHAINEKSGYRVALDSYWKCQKTKTGKMVLDSPEKIEKYMKEAKWA